MSIAKVPGADALSGGMSHSGPRHGEDPCCTTDPVPAKPALSPALLSRFHALVDEVTDELMQGGEPDRDACRADAIALLIATCEQLEQRPENAESPLLHLLLEEQRRAAAFLGTGEAAGQALALWRV